MIILSALPILPNPMAACRRTLGSSFLKTQRQQCNLVPAHPNAAKGRLKQMRQQLDDFCISRLGNRPQNLGGFMQKCTGECFLLRAVVLKDL